MSTPEPEGGLVAYVQRARASHHRIRGLVGDGIGSWCSCGKPLCPQLFLLDHIDNLLDSAPPAPRVFLPGDTVPAGVSVSYAAFTGDGTAAGFGYQDWVTINGAVELAMPTLAEWQATVDRAKAARADSEWQHTEGANP